MPASRPHVDSPSLYHGWWPSMLLYCVRYARCGFRWSDLKVSLGERVLGYCPVGGFRVRWTIAAAGER